MTEELLQIALFIKETKPSDLIGEMEENLFKATGYAQRIGELLNTAEYSYSVNKMKNLEKLESMEEETETTRKAKLDSWSAEDKKLVSDLKNLKTNLRTIQMSLMQSIKTRREELQSLRGNR